MYKRMISLFLFLAIVLALPGVAYATDNDHVYIRDQEEFDDFSDTTVTLSEKEALALFTSLNDTPLMAASGVAAWEGRLFVAADGTFTGIYEDSDADMIYQSYFSGRFSQNVELHGQTYWLWVEELTTDQVPGARGTDKYGDPITYIDAPFSAGDCMVLTLPGTPDSVIPEIVREEIGGALDIWEDFSSIYTLTRQSDGWGFFTKPEDFIDRPATDEWEILPMNWTGIWQSRTTASRLYIFQEEGGLGDYQVIHVMEKNGETRAIRGSLYLLDEITVDYDVPEILHAAIVGDPYHGSLTLTSFPILDDRMTSWMPVIEVDYAYVSPLDDPNNQIPASVRDLTKLGLDPIAAPTAEPVPNPAPAPDIGSGSVLVDDAICTIVCLGKATLESETYVGLPMAYYHLAVTNHLDRDFVLVPGTMENMDDLGSVNGYRLYELGMFFEDGNPDHLSLLDRTRPMDGYFACPIIPAGATVPIGLRPGGGGYSYRTPEELVNVIVNLHLQYDEISPSIPLNQNYSLRMNEGETYQREAFTGYVRHESNEFGFSFEIPNNWIASEYNLEWLDHGNICLLPPPELIVAKGCDSITVQTMPSDFKNIDDPSFITLPDRSIGGRAAVGIKGLNNRCTYYFIPLNDNTDIMITDFCRALEPELEHFLDSIRFTGGSEHEQETDAPDEEREAAVSWTGIWRVPHEQTYLYIFREEGGVGDYQVIHLMEKYTEPSRALQGSLYVIDGITADYDVPGILYASLGADPGGNALYLSVFSAVDERMKAWIPVIEKRYEFVRPLDDPAGQIEPSLRKMAEFGLDPVPDPTPIPVMDSLSDIREGDVLVDDDVCTITYLGKAVGCDPRFSYGPAAYYRLAITNHTDQRLTAKMTSGTVNGMMLWDRLLFREDHGYTSLRNYAPIPAGETKTVWLWPIGVGYGYRHEEELVNAVIGLRVEGDTIQNREYTLSPNPGESYQPPQRTAGYQTRTEEGWNLSYEIPVDWEVYYRERYEHLLTDEPPRMYDWIEILPPPSAEEGIYHIRIQELDRLEPDFASWKTEETLVDGFPAKNYYDDYFTNCYVDLGNGKGMSFLIYHVETSKEEAQPAAVDRFIRSIRFLSAQKPTSAPEEPLPEEAANEADFQYRLLEDGTAEITGYTGSEEKLVIPARIDGYRVTSIGANMFFDCQFLHEVTIPQGVTAIGAYAFFNCSSLNQAVIPDSVVMIGRGAFSGCESLGNISIPSSVAELGANAFNRCGFTEFTIPDSVIRVGDGVLAGCQKLTAIHVSQDHPVMASIDGILVDKLNGRLNSYPAGRTDASYIIPEGIREIGDFAFSQCESLVSVVIPESVISIGANAFSSCEKLTELSMPSRLVYLGEFAFFHCYKLKSIVIPEGVTSLGKDVFGSCKSLISVRLPSSLISIGEEAFCWCEQLNEITIPESVTSIEAAAFFGCAGLRELLIPESVISIGSGAFDRCSSLLAVVARGSYAEAYCQQNNIPYRVLEDQLQPVATAYPDAERTPATDERSAWMGCWMTQDDSLAEMIITDNGNGTLHARALFLPAGDSEATLTPQADGSMRFEDQYGNLVGMIFRQTDGALRLTITGGSIMEDEEATEYQGYFARGFSFYPASYDEMWDQTSAEAAGSDGDWLGDWIAVTDNGFTTLHIRREGANLVWDIMLGQYHFSGLLEMNSNSAADLYNEDFFGTLELNRKLKKIAMMNVGSSISGVYDWMSDNTWYGVVVYQPMPKVTFQIPENNMLSSDQTSTVLPGALQPSPAAVALLPIPGEAGVMQVPIARVDAASYIVGSKDPTAYAPFRMTDGEETTAFQFSTQITPLGQAYLYFDFDGPVTLDELWMKNGFWKTTNGLDQYTRNSRVKKMTIFVRYAGSDEEQMLKDVTLKDDGGRKDWKVINMLGVQNVIGVRIRIDEIYRGSKFPTDVCISEIMFVQHAEH